MDRSIESNEWMSWKDHLKSEYGNLTEDDLNLIENDWEVFANLLVERYGYTWERAVEEAESFMLKHYR